MKSLILSKIGAGILTAVCMGMSGSAAAVDTMSMSFLISGHIAASDIRAVAAKNGRADGLKRGKSDRQKNLPSNFINSAEYRSGMRGYKPRMGSAEVYKHAYQEAFAHGYADGYAGY
jgi:hypothetical protein